MQVRKVSPSPPPPPPAPTPPSTHQKNHQQKIPEKTTLTIIFLFQNTEDTVHSHKTNYAVNIVIHILHQ